MNDKSLQDGYKQLSRKIRKDKKGIMAIEIVIGCFILLILLCILLDIISVGWRLAVVSQTNSYIARTIGLQGGILAAAPDGFSGGNEAYISKSEMARSIANNFERAGIKSNEYTITINGVPLDSGLQVDYGKQLNIDTKVKYSWKNFSNFMPGKLENWMSSKRSVISEFKYRYDYWNGE